MLDLGLRKLTVRATSEGRGREGISTAGTPIGQLLLRYPLSQFSFIMSGFGTASAQKVEEAVRWRFAAHCRERERDCIN